MEFIIMAFVILAISAIIIIAASITSGLADKDSRSEELKLQKQKFDEERSRKEMEHTQNALHKELEAQRNQYKMSSSAKIDYEKFFSSGRSDKSHLFALYLSDACEENIPIITNMFSSVHPDKKQVEDEVAAFMYFSAKMLMKATDLDASEINLKYACQSDAHGRRYDTFWDRQMIYEDIYFDKPVRAYWDPSGNLVKDNTNALISCLMAMCDFIWEPHLKDATDYDEYIQKPVTIKSIDAAMNFQMVYVKVSMQVILFMEMIVGTAHNLDLI